jgi:hypothetical protein
MKHLSAEDFSKRESLALVVQRTTTRLETPSLPLSHLTQTNGVKHLNGTKRINGAKHVNGFELINGARATSLQMSCSNERMAGLGETAVCAPKPVFVPPASRPRKDDTRTQLTETKAMRIFSPDSGEVTPNG